SGLLFILRKGSGAPTSFNSRLVSQQNAARSKSAGRHDARRGASAPRLTLGGASRLFASALGSCQVQDARIIAHVASSMVKRRRLGSCSAQDEKRPEEISEVQQREVGGEPVTPVRCEAAAITTQQLTRTRSQNAPRVTSPSGVQGPASEDGTDKLQPESKSALPAQRSSLRVPKRPRKDASPPPPPASATGTAAGAAAAKKANVSKQAGDAGKTRRTWEQWSADDKSSFFEAVCEFGKDFESIQSYIAQRSKKKGVPAHCIKNKDQVRHFYYRTWHKISKVMNIGEGREDVKKHAQELYGLINYAELRKKYSASINEKNGQLLTELVLTGSTVVKIRGKRIRIKTPLCRALKKLNNVEDVKEEEPRKLPVEVCMEFRPRNNSAWVHVQSLAQNPRVRTKASLQRRLSNVLEHLQGRWRPVRARQKEQILSGLSTGGVDSGVDVEPEPAWELRVWPVGPVSPVSITAAASSLNVSFECHRKKAAADGSKCRKTKQSKSAKQAATEPQQHDANPSHLGNMSASADDNATDMKPLEPDREVTTAEDDAAKSLTLLRSMLEPEPVAVEATDPSPNPNPPPDPTPTPDPSPNPTSFAMSLPSSVIENAEDLLPECKEDGAEKLTLGELLGLAAEEARAVGEEEVKREEEEEAVKKDEEEEKKEEEEEDDQEARERAKNGWTASEAGLMTVGELYLMMGCPDKIVLQYDFCPVEESKEAVTRRCTAMLRKLLSLATLMFAEKNKQGPLSPPVGKSAAAGGGSSGRASGNAGTPPSGKATTGRAIGRSPSSRSVQRPTLQQVQQAQVLENAAESGASQQSSSGAAGDQHVFVVPMGMAPRTHKQGTAGTTVGVMPTGGASIAQEQLDKLLPGHRRGHRMRTTRKPLVVQRPLLPRAHRRPVTLVQLLPSAPATITTMVPQPPPAIVEPLPATVKLLHPGPAFEVQTMPILEPTTVGVVAHPVATEVDSTLMATQATSELVVQCTPQLEATGQQQLSARVEELATPTLEPSANPSVIPSLSPPNISSLLGISLPESLPSAAGPTQLLTDGDVLPSFADASGSSLSGLASLESGSVMESSNPLPNFAEASDSNLASAFGLACEEVRKASVQEDVAKTEALTTPPMSPFKLVPSAPDPNWLNGESSDFSLSSLLNTLDSPLKSVQGSGLSTSGAPVLASDNSTLDSITRLVPDVDTQLQCLMNENSVDYVAKFADLAAQIASSNTESKSS
ncbi:unnamed protein product, partial [Ixodes hexagonus]